MIIEINTKGVEDWAKNQERILLNAFKKIGVQGEGILRSEARKIWYTGNLARSIKNVATSSSVRIQATAEYSTEALETGTPPGRRVSKAALERWGQKKLRKSGLGFILARKIRKEGTRAYRKGGNKSVTKIFNELKDVIVPRYFDNILKAYED